MCQISVTLPIRLVQSPPSHQCRRNMSAGSREAGVGLFFLGVLLWAIIDILGREDLEGSAKGLWVLVVLIFPVVGAAVYLFGMAPKTQRPAAPPARPGSTRPPRPRV